MKKEEFDNIINELLKNKAMTSSDLKDAILDKFSGENKNTIKSMIVRSKLLRSSFPEKFKNGRYAYTLKSNRNYQELFLKLSNDDTNTIRFVKRILSERNSFISIFTFKKLLQINVNNQRLLESKIDALRFYKETIDVKGDYIYSHPEMERVDSTSDFYNKQKTRLLALKILLYKHNAENLILIKKANYLGDSGNSFVFPKPLYNIYFDAYASTPSHIKDLNKPSFAVYDFAINDSYSVSECKSFVSRIIKLKSYGVAVLPICVFKTANPEVMSIIKSSGIVCVKYSSYLGKEYEATLNGLNIIKSDNDLDFSPKELKTLMTNLDQIDLLEQTKGYLFEYVCYRFLNDYYCVKPVRNHSIPKIGNNNGAEFDLIVKLDDETIVCECKATTMLIGFGSLEKANNYTIAHTIDKITLLKSSNKKIIYITTSSYKKISDENKKTISNYVPQNAPISSKCCYTFSELYSKYPTNEWLIIWNNLVQCKMRLNQTNNLKG